MDRSAAYALRWVAKSMVKAGLCRRVLVQVSGSTRLRGTADDRPSIAIFFPTVEVECKMGVSTHLDGDFCSRTPACMYIHICIHGQSH